MVSKEVTAAPLRIPEKCSIALSVSPASSTNGENTEIELASHRSCRETKSQESFFTLSLEGTSNIISSSCTELPKAPEIEIKIRKSHSEMSKPEIMHNSENLENAEIKSAIDIPNEDMKSQESRNLMNDELSKNDNSNCSPALSERIKCLDCCESFENQTCQFGSAVCVYRADIITFISNFKKLISDWLRKIDIKSKDDLGNPVSREDIINTFSDYLQKVSKEDVDAKTMKEQILIILQDIPIDVEQNCEKVKLLNDMAESLVNQMLCYIKSEVSSRNVSAMTVPGITTAVSGVTADESVIKTNLQKLDDFIKNEINHFCRHCHRNICFNRMADIVSGLGALIKNYINDTALDRDENLRLKIIDLLRNRQNFPEEQANLFSLNFCNRLKNSCFTSVNTEASSSFGTYTVFQNQSQNTSWHNKTSFDRSSNKSSFLIQSSSKKSSKYNNSNAEVKIHEKLTSEINEWLDNLNIVVPEEREGKTRSDLINGFANDMINRVEFLHLYHKEKTNDKEELDYVKYLIFKWINHLVGAEQMITVNQAPNLMQRIKTILLFPDNKEAEKTQSNDLRSSLTDSTRDYVHQKMQEPRRATMNGALRPQTEKSYVGHKSSPGVLYPRNIRKKKFSGSANNDSDFADYPNSLTKPMPTRRRKLIQIYEEFDDYLTEWVKLIPIVTDDTEEQKSLAEIARLGIFQGIHRAIAKLKADSENIRNEYLFRDLFEKEINDLLDILPQTEELKAARPMLSARLMEQVGKMNEEINDNKLEAYKEKLLGNVINKVKRGNIAEDSINVKQELELLRIVDNFILSTAFEENDKMKAAAYKNKLLKCAEDFVDHLKVIHGKEFKSIDKNIYINDIMNALLKVPLPSDETVREEADEILLGLEVEHWFHDLPLVQNDSNDDQLQRRRLRDMLTEKIKRIDDKLNLSNELDLCELKTEVSRFLYRMPLETDEDLNIDFMIEELINRLRNRPRLNQLDRSKGFVAFEEPYENFSKSMKFCSSMVETPNKKDSFPDDVSYYRMFSYERPPCSSQMATQIGEHWEESWDPFFDKNTFDYPKNDVNRIPNAHQNMSSDKVKWLTLDSVSHSAPKRPSESFKTNDALHTPVQTPSKSEEPKWLSLDRVSHEFLNQFSSPTGPQSSHDFNEDTLLRINNMNQAKEIYGSGAISSSPRRQQGYSSETPLNKLVDNFNPNHSVQRSKTRHSLRETETSRQQGTKPPDHTIRETPPDTVIDEIANSPHHRRSNQKVGLGVQNFPSPITPSIFSSSRSQRQPNSPRQSEQRRSLQDNNMARNRSVGNPTNANFPANGRTSQRRENSQSRPDERGNLSDDLDDDDKYICRCFEKFLKRRRKNPECSCDGLVGRYPCFVPVPYPFFF